MYRLIIFLLLMFSFSAHGSNGEVGWTSLSFCNGAGYCVDISSSTGKGIDSLQIKRNGKEISLPENSAKDIKVPVLNQVRLINIARSDGIGENRLEIPFLTPQPDGRTIRSVWYLVLLEDRFSKSAVEMTK